MNIFKKVSPLVVPMFLLVFMFVILPIYLEYGLLITVLFVSLSCVVGKLFIIWLDVYMEGLC